MGHKFQINLRGIIDLLSKHLYSGPEVFVRELMQNGVDAIRARAKLDPSHQGEVNFELHSPRGKPATLIVTDNGVGLTEDEVHRFLATIGESSKKAADGEGPTDFIGQFGIGILSCFVVSEEIVVISKSAREAAAPAVEWRGQAGRHLRCQGARQGSGPRHAGHPDGPQGPGRAVRLRPRRRTGAALRRPAAVPDPHPRRAEERVDQRARRPLAAGVPQRQGADPRAAGLRQAGVRGRVLRRHPAALRGRRRGRRGLRAAVRGQHRGQEVAPGVPEEHAPVGERRQPAAGLGLLRQGGGERQRPEADGQPRELLRGRQPRKRAGRPRRLAPQVPDRHGREAAGEVRAVPQPALPRPQGAGGRGRRVLQDRDRLPAVRDDAGEHELRRVPEGIRQDPVHADGGPVPADRPGGGGPGLGRHQRRLHLRRRTARQGPGSLRGAGHRGGRAGRRWPRPSRTWTSTSRIRRTS